MNTVRSELVPGLRGELFPVEQEMIEVDLLLTVDQAKALEEAAHRRNVTIGQLTRSLIKTFLGNSDTSAVL